VYNRASIINKQPVVGQLHALIFKALPILFMHHTALKMQMKEKSTSSTLPAPAGASLCSLGIGLPSFTLNQS